MKLSEKLVLPSIISILFFCFLYLIKSVLTPFIIAILIAYFLNPLVGKLQKYKISRANSSLIIITLFLLLVSFVLLLITPLLYNQALNLSNSIPSYFEFFVGEIYPKTVDLLSEIGLSISNDYHDYLNGNIFSNLLGSYSDLLNNILKSGFAVFNVISLSVVTPVIVFYMIKDWDLLIDKINDYLPVTYKANIVKLCLEIDRTLSGYVKGQFNVCLILGLFYSLALTLSGLNFGFLIGFITGLLSFIPFVGMGIGVFTALLVGCFQWGLSLIDFIVVISIFTAGQIIESNFLTPRLVGKKIGLHPVWIIFGLFVFGSLFGFIGVLLAIPLTAIFGVILKFFAAKYKESFCHTQSNS